MSNPTVVMAENQTPAWARQTAHTLSEMEQAKESEVVLVSTLDSDTGDDSENSDVDLDERTATRAAIAELTDADFSVSTLGIQCEERSDGIVRAITRVDADRAYMYGRNRTPVGKAVFGSTLGDVIARAPVPVVVVPPTSG